MLQPTAVVNSILESIQSIPELAVELGAPTIPPTESIIGHGFFSGAENSIARAIEQMRSPSMLLAYLDLISGNFDGMTVWKHRVTLYARARNAAVDGNAASAPDLINLALNYPITAPVAAANIRYVDLLNNSLWFYSTNAPHATDVLNQDVWQATMVWNEYGDAGPVTADAANCGPSQTLLQALEQEAIEQLLTQRNEVIALLGEDQNLIEKINAVYQTMIRKEMSRHGDTHTE